MNSQRTFDPLTYVNQFFKAPQLHQQVVEIQDKYSIWSKEAFDIIESCENGIQIGCGPVPLLSAFASRKVSNIYLTEYNTDCFKFFQSWMENEKNQFCINWSKEFQAIAKIEGTNDNVDERLRKSLVGCLKIDLNRDQIFEYPMFKKFDVIYSQLCIESASTDDAYFKKSIGNLKKYLKGNGYLLLLGILGETYYIVGEQKLPCHYVTNQLLKLSMDENGFQIIKFDYFYQQNPPTLYGDWKGFFSLLARLPQKQTK